MALRPARTFYLPSGQVLILPVTSSFAGLGALGRDRDGVGALVRQRFEGSLGYPEVQIPEDVRVVRIPNGLESTEATLKIMKKLALSPWGSRNPAIVLLANKIRDNVPSKDYVAEADAIFRWVKGNVRYKLDPLGLEWLQTPTFTLRRRAGDCDDHSVLIASLAMASGHRAAFRTVKADPERPDSFSHVYPVIGVTSGGKTEWLAADSTQRESSLGWDPQGLEPPTTWVIDPTTEDREWDS